MDPTRSQMVCRFFKEGRCTKGAACSFSHIDDPSPTAAEYQVPASPTGFRSNGPPQVQRPCIFFQQGRCQKGDMCPYSHALDFVPSDAPPQESTPTMDDLPDDFDDDLDSTDSSCDPQEWYPSSRDCSCCKGYIYGCSDDTCRALGVCGCAAHVST